MSTTTSKRQLAIIERAEAIETMRHHCPPGSTVYCSLERVSRSGMQRSIKVYTIIDDDLIHLSYTASLVTGWKRKAREVGVTVDGTGMDMGFHLVYTLASIIHGDGYALTARWI